MGKLTERIIKSIANKLDSRSGEDKDFSAAAIKEEDGLREMTLVELESESLTGDSTGKVQDDGTSVTTDLPEDKSNPTITERPAPPSTGHVMINKPTTATNTSGGNLRSGHGEAIKKPKAEGIQKPGDAKDTRTEDESGEK